jgi:hypothetical protein
MELRRVLSNHESSARLRRLADKLDSLPRTAVRTGEAAGTPRPKRLLDPISGTVRRVLEEACGPMQARAIHREVEVVRGEPVSWSTVKNILAKNATAGRFKRLERGRYCAL